MNIIIGLVAFIFGCYKLKNANRKGGGYLEYSTALAVSTSVCIIIIGLALIFDLVQLW
jgi:hypothetical protein